MGVFQFVMMNSDKHITKFKSQIRGVLIKYNFLGGRIKYDQCA